MLPGRDLEALEQIRRLKYRYFRTLDLKLSIGFREKNKHSQHTLHEDDVLEVGHAKLRQEIADFTHLPETLQHLLVFCFVSYSPVIRHDKQNIVIRIPFLLKAKTVLHGLENLVIEQFHSGHYTEQMAWTDEDEKKRLE